MRFAPYLSVRQNATRSIQQVWKMKGFENKYFNKSFGKINLYYGLAGVAIGSLISVAESTIANKLIPPRGIISNLIFSLFITLCLTYSIYLFARFWRARRSPKWYFIFVFYGYNLLGLLIGIEVSYLVTGLIFDNHFQFASSFSNYSSGLLAFIIVGTIIYSYRLQQATMSERLQKKELDLVKLKQMMTQAELQTLQSKINPHFLYNALNSIASLIHEDANRAEDMTIKLSRLFRYSINASRENMASVREEMEIVTTYLAIEKIRFGDRFGFAIDVDKSVRNEHIPRFLIQPLVENSLKHGLNDMPGNGQLRIGVSRHEKNIIISVADNGKPFPAELNIGYGLQSTYDKLALLYGENHEVQIVNSPEKKITILIPLTT